MVKLQEELSREDKAVFGFDIKTDFDWKEYLETYVQVFIIDNGFRKIKTCFQNQPINLVMLHIINNAKKVLI